MGLKPILSVGLNIRLDPDNGVFYVNTCAWDNEKRCFWNAPFKVERACFEKFPKFWQKACSNFGRIY